MFLFGELQIFFVLGAEIFEEVFIGKNGCFLSVCEGLRVHLGIINRHFDFEVARIGASKSFYKMHVLTMGMAHRVEPALIVETDRIYHKRVAVPFAGGIAQPSWLGILTG